MLGRSRPLHLIFNVFKSFNVDGVKSVNKNGKNVRERNSQVITVFEKLLQNFNR